MILKLGTTARNLILMPLGGATGAYLRTAILGFWAPYTPHSKPIVDFEGFWRIFEEKTMGKHPESCQKHWKRCQTTKNQPRTTIGCTPDGLGGVLGVFRSSVGLVISQCSTNAYRSVEPPGGQGAQRVDNKQLDHV